MTRVLFLTWDGGGNLPPTIGIAQELRARGHAVVVAGQELAQSPAALAAGHVSLRARLADQGFPFQRLEHSTAAWTTEPPERRIVTMMMACPEHLRDVPEVLAQVPSDVVVVDCLMFGALAAVEALGIPVAVLVHSAPGALAGPGGPMDGFLLGAVNEVRVAAGREPVTSLWEAWARFPALCATIPELDPLAAQAPPSFAYVGPIFPRGAASGWHSPWDRDDPRPLVLVSFTSTAAWDQTSRIRRTLDALADRPYRVLVTASLADVSGIPVPGNAVVARHVPHDEVLPQVAVTVNHAGHGSVARSLAYGVPLVCLPNPVADQPPLAAQIQALGAGRALDGEHATVDEIGEAVDAVLTEPAFTRSACRLAEVISATSGAATAASLVVRLIQPETQAAAPSK